MPRSASTFVPLLVLLSACSRAREYAPGTNPGSSPAAPAAEPALAGGAPGRGAPSLAQVTPSLAQAATSVSVRKIIRNAELAILADDPVRAEQQATEIAERLGGFVVSSEARRFDESAGESTLSEVTLVLRVPAEKFAAALGELRKLGTSVSNEKVTAQDVTEEYIDVEAELRTKGALEAQFIEVLKQAKAVKDILEVQTHLAGVRTELEKLEGRRRFLENQTALSTIQMRIDEPRSLVHSSASSFGRSFKDAWGDMRNFSATLVNVGIRSLGFLLPVLVLVGLPLYGAFWLMRRRRRGAMR